MTATAKKLLSALLAFALAFAFMPTVALGGVEDDGVFTDAVNDSMQENISQEEPIESGERQPVLGAPTDGLPATMETQAERYRFDFGDGRWIYYEDYADAENDVDSIVIMEIGVPTTGYQGTHDMVIPGSIEGKTVVGIGRDKDNPCKTPNLNYMDKVTIPASVRFVYGVYFPSQKDGVFFEDGSLVTELYPSMFGQYDGKEVKLPDGLTEIPYQMFVRSEQLESIVLPSATQRINSEAFTFCKSLSSVTLNNGLQVIGLDAFAHLTWGQVYNGDFPHITEINIPASVNQIEARAFRKVTTLGKVSFGTKQQTSTLASIGDEAFYGTNLTQVDIPDAVTTIGAEAFSGTNGYGGTGEYGNGDFVLATVNLGSSQSTSLLTTLGSRAFAHQPIKSIALPNKLASLGYDASTLSVSNNNDGVLSGTRGAFSNCDKLENVIWPTANSGGFTTVGGFDNCTSLTGEAVSSLPSWVAAIDDYAFYNCTAMDDVQVPATVTRIGKGAFSKARVMNSTGKTFTLLSKDVTLDGWTEADPTTGPWPLECGYTIRYPHSAAPDSSIVKYRAAVEAYEAAKNTSEANKTKFVTTADEFYHVSGTVPAGASVRLYVDGTMQERWFEAAGSFTTDWIEKGSLVGVVVSLDGYKDYVASPVAGKSVAALTGDWSFDATAAGAMVPISELGILQVTATSGNRANCNIAVLDANGKLVSQGGALRCSLSDGEEVPVYVVDDIPAGSYTVVGWQENEYFSRISSVSDFAAMGFKESDYAKAEATIAAGQTRTVRLTIPALDASAIAGVLATGDVAVPGLYNPPGVPFVATVSYDMTTGQSIDSVQVSIPQGMEPLAAATPSSQYYSKANEVNANYWDDGNHMLTISGLEAADRQTGTISLSLKATDPGSYTVSASVKCDSTTAPLGAARVECPAIRLVAPEGTLRSRTFTAHVYAAPNSKVKLTVGQTVAVEECTTNLVGHAKAEVTIPENEISVSPYYQVTATLVDDSTTEPPSDTAIVQFNATFEDIPLEPTVYDFSFESAGSTVNLAKAGQDLSGGWYTVVPSRGTHPNIFTKAWPFTAVIDSLQPLEGTATLYLGMLDNSVKTYDLHLSETADLASGAKRYTYRAIVPLSEDDTMDSGEIPCRFDVMPGLQSVEDVVQPEPTPASMSALNLAVGNEADKWNKLGAQSYQAWLSEISTVNMKYVTGEYFATDSTIRGYGYDYFDVVDKGYDYVFGVFNKSFHHDTWDPDHKIWNQLDDAQKAKVEAAEEKVATAYDALALLLGDSKPMYEYASLEDYLENEYGYATGRSFDPDALRAKGYVLFQGDGAGGSTQYAANLMLADGRSALAPQGEAVLTTQEAPADDSATFTTVSSKGEEMSKTAGAQTDIDALIEIIGDSTEDVMEMLEAQEPELANKICGFAVRGAGLARSIGSPIENEIKTRTDYTGLNAELIDRQNELARLQAMDEFYNRYKPGSLCQKALQAEIDLMKNYINDLKWASRFSVLGQLGSAVAGGIDSARETAEEWSKTLIGKCKQENIMPESEANILGNRLSGYFDKAKGLGIMARLGIGAQASLPSVILAPHMATNRAQVKTWRFHREKECKKDDFGKLHYDKKPGIDPSGFTYEAVLDNRVSDVIAKIYQLQDDGSWAEWNAASMDQENPQTTNSGGLFAWDVPEGDWKVLFQKEGYQDVWSQVMHVLPAWTNVAVNILRTDAPKGTGATVNADDEESPYVDISFDQYMKAAADLMPTVTVGDVAVTNATWVDAVSGTDKDGAAVMLSRVLRVPLAGLAEPGVPVVVSVDSACSYADKQMAAPYTATVTIPDDPTYFYVTPDEAVEYTKGSGETLSFTFKRSSHDKRTFERFQGIQVDGASVDAANYTAVAGSVVVTLKSSYLETLETGDHTLAAQFADGNATAGFTVNAPAKAAKVRAATPATGDRMPVATLLAIVALSAAVLVVSWRQRRPATAGKHVKK